MYQRYTFGHLSPSGFGCAGLYLLPRGSQPAWHATATHHPSPNPCSPHLFAHDVATNNRGEVLGAHERGCKTKKVSNALEYTVVAARVMDPPPDSISACRFMNCSTWTSRSTSSLVALHTKSLLSFASGSWQGERVHGKPRT